MSYNDEFGSSAGLGGDSFDEEPPIRKRSRNRRNDGYSRRNMALDRADDSEGGRQKKSGNMAVNIILIVIIVLLLVAIVFCILYLTKAWRPKFMKTVFGANTDEGWECGSACDPSIESNDTQACGDNLAAGSSDCSPDNDEEDEEEKKRRLEEQGLA